MQSTQASATSRYLDGDRREGEAPASSGQIRAECSVNADDDLGVAEPDHVAVGQLPLLHRCVVHRGAVRGIEVGQQRDLAVPADLEMPAGHARVRQPELCVLAPSDHVGALTQLVGTAAAVVELQGDGRGAGRVAAVGVAPAIALPGGLTVVVPAARGLAVAGFGVSGACRGLAVAAVVLLGAIALVLTAVRLPAIAALIGVAPLVWVAALVGVARTRLLATVATVFGTAGCGLTAVVVPAACGLAVTLLSTLRRAVAAGRLPVTVVRIAATGRWAVAGRRTLLIRRRRVAPLVGVAALVGVAPALRVGRITLRGIAALL